MFCSSEQVNKIQQSEDISEMNRKDLYLTNSNWTYAIEIVWLAVIGEMYAHAKYIAGEIFSFFRCRCDIETDDIDHFIVANALQAFLQEQTIQPLQLRWAIVRHRIDSFGRHCALTQNG